MELVADESTRAAVAKLAGLAALPRLVAAFDVTRRGDGLRVVGSVSATVGQTCVVTLEPLENDVEEEVDLLFSPSSAPEIIEEDGSEVEITDPDAPEPLIGGVIDLGAIATEFLILGLDPYPRKPGAVFEQPTSDDPSSHPFAALAELKKRQGRDGT
jgi:hypothetical protein